MLIKQIKIINFKKFKDAQLKFNEDINIIVGDNESGKSTLLEAIEICTNFTYRGRPIKSEIGVNLFNKDCIDRYLEGDKSQSTLPEILIEAYLDGVPSLRGQNNSLKKDAEGLYVKVSFNEELSDSYLEFIKDPLRVTTLPVELYKTEWYDFGWNPITQYNKKIKCLYIDQSRLHPSYGRNRYISNVISSALTKNARSSLNLNFRQLKGTFDTDPDVVKINKELDSKNTITNKKLKISADLENTKSWESSLQLSVDEVGFGDIGRGEQSQIQIKLAMVNKSEDINLLLIEEPENHLSHINLIELINHIEKFNLNKQIFITTHSSYVLNRLRVNKVCLLSNANKFIRLKKVDKKTVNKLRRLPGYDTLRVVLNNKILLVEGPSDELILKKIFIETQSSFPEENGIDIVVVRGIGFKNFLEIAKHLDNNVHVVKDNDGDYEKNIEKWGKQYSQFDHIEIYSHKKDNCNSLEPALIESNSQKIRGLNQFAKIALSKQTYKKYDEGDIDDRKEFLLDWFSGEKAGGRKVDSALRIFDSTKKIKFPSYLKDAITFE